jgi:hypothetical protein
LISLELVQTARHIISPGIVPPGLRDGQDLGEVLSLSTALQGSIRCKKLRLKGEELSKKSFHGIMVQLIVSDVDFVDFDN